MYIKRMHRARAWVPGEMLKWRAGMLFNGSAFKPAGPHRGGYFTRLDVSGKVLAYSYGAP